MKKILIYLILLVSVAVLAQQQLANLQDPAAGGAGQKEQPVDASTDESADPGTATGSSATGQAADSDSAGSEDSPDGEAGAEASATDMVSDPQKADADFEPTEEISEDYPVPLPSDI